MMKTTRQFHRRINFTSTSEERKKCEHSLAHSLRITPPTGEKKAENMKWDHELEANDLILVNGQLSSLNSWPEQVRLEFLYQIAPQPKIRSQSHLQDQLRKYRLKMKNAIESEQKNGNVLAADFLQKILEAKNYVSYSRIEQFAELPMRRKKQRLNMLKIYLNAHNQLQNRPCANAVYLQEGIFKIPHQWEVNADTLSLREYMQFAEQFLKAHFPEYPILAIIGHDDERGLDQQTGHHPHYFLSGRNEETGEYDLHKRQIQVVNNYIKETYPEHELLPSNGKLNLKQSKMFGSYFQILVRDYANEHLFHPKSLHIEFSPESERRSEQSEKMNREAKLPILQRSHNHYSYQLERLQKRIARAKKAHKAQIDASEQKLSLLADELKQKQIAMNSLQKQHAEMTDAIQTKQSQLHLLADVMEQTQIVLRSKQEEVTKLSNEKNHLAALKQELTQDVGGQLVNIFRQLIVVLNAKEKGMQQQQIKYLAKAAESVLKLPPRLSEMMMAELAMFDPSKEPEQELERD